ncbi:hypothetical protein D3C73_1526190 [compost metagenome]
MAAVFFVAFRHIFGQLHDPVTKFVGCSEAYTFAWTIGIERNQYVATITGSGTGPVKVIRPH